MRPQIYLFGDSITEESFIEGGWGSSLAHHFSRSMDVILRGYSGYNTRWALKVVEKVFSAAETSEPPVAVVVFFGANDASIVDRCSGLQHVPLLEYKENLHSIVSFIKNRWPKTYVLLITPPPIDEDGRLRFPFSEDASDVPERTNEAAGAYAKGCLEVANESGVPAIDLWTKMQGFPNWGNLFLKDGLHLTKMGNRIVFEEVVEKLKEEGLSLEKLPVDLPLFSDLDSKDPLKAFEN